MSLLVYSVTLDLADTSVVVVGAVALDVFFCNARSVVLIICHIYSPPLLLPKFLIALDQSAIATITL